MQITSNLCGADFLGGRPYSTPDRTWDLLALFHHIVFKSTLDGQPLEISLPLKSQGLFAGYPWIYLAPRNIKALQRTKECTAGRSWKNPGPEIIQVLEKTREGTAGRSWKYPGGIFLFFDRRLIGQFGLITGGENLFEWDFIIRFWKIGNQCI